MVQPAKRRESNNEAFSATGEYTGPKRRLLYTPVHKIEATHIICFRKAVDISLLLAPGLIPNIEYLM